MKNFILFLLLSISVTGFAQDSTKVIGLQLQARLIEYIAPTIANPSNNETFDLFIKFRTALRATNAVNNTNVTIDTIGTELLASLYNRVLDGPEGLGAGALMKAQIAAKRASNSFLNRLCTTYEQEWAVMLIERRARGRRLLLGK